MQQRLKLHLFFIDIKGQSGGLTFHIEISGQKKVHRPVDFGDVLAMTHAVLCLRSYDQLLVAKGDLLPMG